MNMKMIYLIMSLVLVLCGCSQKAQPTWKPMLDGGHHVGIDGASIFAFGYDHDRGSETALTIADAVWCGRCSVDPQETY